METIELKSLCKITRLDENTLKSLMIKHTKVYGILLFTQIDSKSVMLNEHYSQILEEYETIYQYVPDTLQLRELALDKIPFARGSYLYFLFDNGKLVYIGQTITLASRIGEHIKTKVFDKVASISVPDEIRLDIEAVNISIHKPTYNQTSGDSSETFSKILKKLFS